MAVATVAPRISSIQPTVITTVITSEEISRYAEITAQLLQLESTAKGAAD